MEEVFRGMIILAGLDLNFVLGIGVVGGVIFVSSSMGMVAIV
jgi:hypothetical protein